MDGWIDRTGHSHLLLDLANAPRAARREDPVELNSLLNRCESLPGCRSRSDIDQR